MSGIISELTSWVQAVITWLFGGSIGTGSTAVEVDGVFGTILGQPVLVAFLIGIPIVTLLVSVITRLIKRSTKK